MVRNVKGRDSFIMEGSDRMLSYKISINSAMAKELSSKRKDIDTDSAIFNKVMWKLRVAEGIMCKVFFN